MTVSPADGKNFLQSTGLEGASAAASVAGGFAVAMTCVEARAIEEFSPRSSLCSIFVGLFVGVSVSVITEIDEFSFSAWSLAGSRSAVSSFLAAGSLLTIRLAGLALRSLSTV